IVCFDTPTSRATSSTARPASTCFKAAIISASLCLLRDMLIPLSFDEIIINFVRNQGSRSVGNIAFSGVMTQTITSPGGAPAPQLNHFDGHFTVVGTATGQISGTQYLTQETFHNSEAGRMVFPFIQTITHNFRIVSKGGSSNLAFSETYHLTILETGETAVTFDNVRTYCQ